MAKSKLRGSWVGKVEAQEGLGVANPNLRRASGSISGRSGVTPGELWAGLGRSGGEPIYFQQKHVNFFEF